MQRHQRGFVAVLVVHIVNDVQRTDVLHGQPVHKVVQALHHHVVIQHVIHQRRSFRPDLDFQLLIHTAVDCVQQCFGEVGTRTKELHLFADDHRADAAGNGIVIAFKVSAHQIVIFIL
ncbi:hypothetical protein D3C73_1194660 [compost metagenome]